MQVRGISIGLAAVFCAAQLASADVFNMSGGLTSLETVPVGNPGNAADPETGYGAVAYDYRIGKFEVTTGQYTEFLNKVAGVDKYSLYNTSMWSNTYGCKIERFAGTGTEGDPYQYRVAAKRANRPVNFVSWGDAARFANWLTKGQPEGPQGLTTTEDGSYSMNDAVTDAELMLVRREGNARYVLTSEDEWYKAAYHKNDGVAGNYWDYPTGSETISGAMANYAWSGGGFTAVGAYGGYPSPYGTFDQGGNVWEWNEIETVTGSAPGQRGGSFAYPVSGLGASERYVDDYPAAEFGSLGFRVAEVPEPATLAMLALGGLALLRRKASGFVRA